MYSRSISVLVDFRVLRRELTLFTWFEDFKRKNYHKTPPYAQKLPLFPLSSLSYAHKLTMNKPEIIFRSSDRAVARQLTKDLKKGNLRELLPRVYTSNLTDDSTQIVKRNLWSLIGGLYPGTLVSHRTALEFKPSPEQVVYLTGKSRRIIRWPGIDLNVTDGPAAVADDNSIAPGLYVSSLERACLENLLPSRKRGKEDRALAQAKIEERLLQYLNSRGEEGLNIFRDRARQLALTFGWTKAFDRLDGIVSSLLSTRAADVLTSPLARAKAFGRPYDAHRLELFTELAGSLRSTDFEVLIAKTPDENAFSNFAFFESYFSNYIEGTTFRVDEARQIIFESKIITGQQEDSHDVLATYELCGSRVEMATVATNFSDFLEVLRRRHRILMRARPAKLPGQFKVNENRAGNTFFVGPTEVIGTLEKGFELLSALPTTTARALFTMFLISEVHPFEDGNGRIARLMMNAELSSAGESKIIIPTVYREDYLLNLRRLTRDQDAVAFIRMMQRAQAFSHWLNPGDFDPLKRQLEDANAFDEEGKVLRF